jgi:hypothetical protein
VHIEDVLEAALPMRSEDNHLENSDSLTGAELRAAHNLDVLMQGTAEP